jgi:hypothetical protein
LDGQGIVGLGSQTGRRHQIDGRRTVN